MVGNERLEFFRGSVGLQSDLGTRNVSGEQNPWKQSRTLYERGMIVDG